MGGEWAYAGALRLEGLVALCCTGQHDYFIIIQRFLPHIDRNHGIYPDNNSSFVLTTLGIRYVCRVQSVKVIRGSIFGTNANKIV